jgi:hypothetical protein
MVLAAFNRSGCTLYDKRIRKEVGIIVCTNMHSTFVDIEDGSSSAIENAELFFSPTRLFCMMR